VSIWASTHELPARTIFNCLLDGGFRKLAQETATRVELDVAKPFGKLSKGNRQKVLLIVAEMRARASASPVLLLDEPFTGLDTHARDTFVDLWESHVQGILRLITTHPDHDALALQRPVIITEGSIRLARPEEGRFWGDLKSHLN
jgi:ABC-type multidrug transport system ATPase subunit